jgi:hypothetical protein
MVCKPIHSLQVCVSSAAVISGESHVVVSSLIDLVRFDLVQDAGRMQLPVQKHVRRHTFLDAQALKPAHIVVCTSWIF